MKAAGLSPLSQTASTLFTGQMLKLAETLKNWRFHVTGPLTWDHAQVTGGGVLLEEVGRVIVEGGVGVTISSQSGWRMPALTAEQDA